MKLLVKFPTRERTDLFFTRLHQYHSLLEKPSDIEFIISADEDDESMNNAQVKNRIAGFQNTRIFFGPPRTKIQACNADVEKASDWDILLLASDDMEPKVSGYDGIIRREMKTHFPDTDGTLFFNDGKTKDKLNTLCILGRKYYERFGYIYHPDYVSFYCDNEYTEVARTLGKMRYFPQVIIEHRHFSFEKTKPDRLYRKNGKFSGKDCLTFKRRARSRFGLT